MIPAATTIVFEIASAMMMAHRIPAKKITHFFTADMSMPVHVLPDY